MKTTESLNWRYATKKFDTTRKVSNDDLAELLESLRLAPSSYGLQPWKFIVVTNKDLRERLKEQAWNQAQITEASHLIVLAAKKGLDELHVKKYVEDISQTRGVPVESLKGYHDMMMGSITPMSKKDLTHWNKRQVYIALGMLLETAAIKNIDSCPMEGFDSKKFDKILGLKEFTSTVLCPVGYRSVDDIQSRMKKVRFNDVIEFRE